MNNRRLNKELRGTHLYPQYGVYPKYTWSNFILGSLVNQRENNHKQCPRSRCLLQLSVANNMSTTALE